MRILEWLAELRFRNPILYQVGMIHFILSVLLLVPMLFDHREVMGVNAWVKPWKFCLTNGLYLWTIGWLLFEIRNFAKVKYWVSQILAFSMVGIIIIIIYQAFRGVPSHFNMDAVFDASLYRLLGSLLVLVGILSIVVFVIYVIRKPHGDESFVLTVRLSFLLFFFSGWIGLQMLSEGSSNVWYRTAHIVGLLSLQLLPLLSFFIHQMTDLSVSVRQIIMAIFVITYGAVISWLYYQF